MLPEVVIKKVNYVKSKRRHVDLSQSPATRTKGKTWTWHRNLMTFEDLRGVFLTAVFSKCSFLPYHRASCFTNSMQRSQSKRRSPPLGNPITLKNCINPRLPIFKLLAATWKLRYSRKIYSRNYQVFIHRPELLLSRHLFFETHASPASAWFAAMGSTTLLWRKHLNPSVILSFPAPRFYSRREVPIFERISKDWDNLS